MKSLDILLSILDEAHLKTCASMERDRITIQSRYKDEGESFLGITLPAFSEWLEESLQQGSVATSIYVRFRKRPKHKSVLPCFLHGLTSRVFDAKTGALLAHPSPLAVMLIRQICLFYKKVFKVCDPLRDQQAKRAYKSVDDSLRSMPKFPKEKVVVLNAVCRRFMPQIDHAFRLAIDDVSILPRHGPGATADKAWANKKYQGRDFLRRWDDLFSWEHLYGFSTIHQTNRELVQPRDEQPVKVVSVPKTMKTSRIICVEPTAMQFAQQLTAARLVKSLQARSQDLKPGLIRHLHFDDQSFNQRAAREGSMNGNLATVDLSEASDRVSVKLIQVVFRHSPLLMRHLFGCRSTRAMMQDGTVFHLRKYASMGSALTFPVEAVCFLTICIAAVCDQRSVFNCQGRPKSREAFENARKDILVFGDDLIVPADCIVKVTEYLEAFGLKVNSKKTFYKGAFRESCGHDYFNGVLVTPVYLRQDPPQSHRDSVSFVSWVHMSNRFLKAGWSHTAARIREYINTIYKLPAVRETCAGLGWHLGEGFADYQWRFNRSLNAPEKFVKTLVPSSSKFRDELGEYDRLLFFHLNRGASQFYLSDPDRSPKRNSLKLRLRKVTL
jgi:hypothetical protein